VNEKIKEVRERFRQHGLSTAIFDVKNKPLAIDELFLRVPTVRCGESPDGWTRKRVPLIGRLYLRMYLFLTGRRSNA